MHSSKDSMWREIWKILQNFLGTKQGLSGVSWAQGHAPFWCVPSMSLLTFLSVSGSVLDRLLSTCSLLSQNSSTLKQCTTYFFCLSLPTLYLLDVSCGLLFMHFIIHTVCQRHHTISGLVYHTLLYFGVQGSSMEIGSFGLVWIGKFFWLSNFICIWKLLFDHGYENLDES